MTELQSIDNISGDFPEDFEEEDDGLDPFADNPYENPENDHRSFEEGSPPPRCWPAARAVQGLWQMLYDVGRSEDAAVRWVMVEMLRENCARCSSDNGMPLSAAWSTPCSSPLRSSATRSTQEQLIDPERFR